MNKCNCKVIYHAQEEEYTTSINIVKRGFNTLDMLWDTGAGNTVIYLNLLRKVKSIDKSDLNELEKLLNSNNRKKIEYRSKVFSSALIERTIGILCCIYNVYVNHLHLKNFYFFVLPTNENKNRGLLGADFISCCQRYCNAGSDEIFTSFDNDLYEQKFKAITAAGSSQKPVCNLNLIKDQKMEISQKLTATSVAREMNVF